MCRDVVGPRSYEVEVNGSNYRRNLRHLIHGNEQPPVDVDVSTPDRAMPEVEHSQPELEQASKPDIPPVPQMRPAITPTIPEVRRSTRIRKPPDRYEPVFV